MKELLIITLALYFFVRLADSYPKSRISKFLKDSRNFSLIVSLAFCFGQSLEFKSLLSAPLDYSFIYSIYAVIFIHVISIFTIKKLVCPNRSNLLFLLFLVITSIVIFIGSLIGIFFISILDNSNHFDNIFSLIRSGLLGADFYILMSTYGMLNSSLPLAKIFSSDSSYNRVKNGIIYFPLTFLLNEIIAFFWSRIFLNEAQRLTNNFITYAINIFFSVASAIILGLVIALLVNFYTEIKLKFKQILKSF